jgi:LacI family transcriptional regulator
VSLVIAACRSFTPRVAFEWEHYSAVKIESPHLTVPLYTVSSDQRQAARLAFRKLREAGYRRLGLVSDPGGTPRQDELYRAGFLLEQTRWPDVAAVPPLALRDDTPDSVLLSWIQQHRVDAILTDRQDLLERLPKIGLNVPKDVALAGLDLPNGGADGLAGIAADHGRVGAQAVEQVVSLMRTNQRGLPTTASCTYVPVSWHDGASAPAK